MYVAPSKVAVANGILICDVIMMLVFATRQNKTKRKNKDPDAIKTGLRVNNVTNWMYDFLEEGMNFTEKDYQVYLQQMTGIILLQKENLSVNCIVSKGR